METAPDWCPDCAERAADLEHCHGVAIVHADGTCTCTDDGACTIVELHSLVARCTDEACCR